MNRGCNVRLDDVDGKVAFVAHHRCEARNRLSWRVCVKRCQRTVVPRVHGLQHVDCFGSTTLTYDDAVGSHAQRIDDQVAYRHLAFAFRIAWTRFEAGNIWMRMKAQLGRILNRHDALLVGDNAR